MNHSFDIENAKKYGVIEAVILENMLHWLSVNKANETNIHDGKVWTYNSVQAYSRLFPYLTPKQIRRAIDSLVDENAIVKGEYNKANYDKTSWYSVPDESILAIGPKGQMDSPKRADRSVQNGKPIPDINTSVNTDTHKTATRAASPHVNDILKIIYEGTENKQSLFTDHRIRKLVEKAIESDGIELLKASLSEYLAAPWLREKRAHNFTKFFSEKATRENWKPKTVAKVKQSEDVHWLDSTEFTDEQKTEILTNGILQGNLLPKRWTEWKEKICARLTQEGYSTSEILTAYLKKEAEASRAKTQNVQMAS